MKLKRCGRRIWGLQIGRVHLTWLDLWTNRPCFEITKDARA